MERRCPKRRTLSLSRLALWSRRDSFIFVVSLSAFWRAGLSVRWPCARQVVQSRSPVAPISRDMREPGAIAGIFRCPRCRHAIGGLGAYPVRGRQCLLRRPPASAHRSGRSARARRPRPVARRLGCRPKSKGPVAACGRARGRVGPFRFHARQPAMGHPGHAELGPGDVGKRRHRLASTHCCRVPSRLFRRRDRRSRRGSAARINPGNTPRRIGHDCRCDGDCLGHRRDSCRSAPTVGAHGRTGHGLLDSGRCAAHHSVVLGAPSLRGSNDVPC